MCWFLQYSFSHRCYFWYPMIIVLLLTMIFYNSLLFSYLTMGQHRGRLRLRRNIVAMSALITFVGVSSSFVMLAATATSSSAITTTDYFVPGYGMFWDSLRRRRSAGVGEEYASRRLLVEDEMSYVRRSDDVSHHERYDRVPRWNRLRDAMIFFHPPAPITPYWWTSIRPSKINVSA